MMTRFLIISICLLPGWLPIANAISPTVMSVDVKQVKQWNQFADDIYSLHKAQTLARKVRTESHVSGYATHPDFYEETRYYDDESGLLLSRIQRVRKDPDIIHLIEVNVYNDQNMLQRDYLAAYLPDHRNAPIQTLINLHARHDDLQAFRQFDASGVRIYEQCKGKYAGKSVFISLEEDQLHAGPQQQSALLASEIYKLCFATLPAMAGGLLQPVTKPGPSLLSVMAQASSYDEVQADIEELSRELEKESGNTANLMQRANLYFVLGDFDLAVIDYSDALRQDASLDNAYFGRGMALARNGQIKEGIADLSTYIDRHPSSSVAYTKRGVRYLWLGNDKRAEADLRQALRLDPDNAEAHDDLGVVFARRGEYEQALEHFSRTVSLDPTYIKGFHNLAMVYYITGQDLLALATVEKVLAATPQARDSLMLKVEILKQLGRVSEAAAIKEEAEFLPEGNWSEHISVN